MDPTLNADTPARLAAARSARLAALRSVRSWRAGLWLPARVLTLMVPIAAVLAWCFLALGSVQARVQIDFDPMRPPASASPAASAVGADTPADGAAAAPALPTLKITRMTGGAGALSALVDDTWVRRGDVVAGYRVIAVRTESIDLVNLADPAQRLTLRLNPVTVDRNELNRNELTRADAAKAPPAWPSLALEKK